MDGLTTLVDQSLVSRGAGEGEPRFGMLETLREYGLEALAASGEHDRVRQAHACYFAELAEAAEPILVGLMPEKAAEQREWLACLEAEHANLRAALEWALERGGRAQPAVGGSAAAVLVFPGLFARGSVGAPGSTGSWPAGGGA